MEIVRSLSRNLDRVAIVQQGSPYRYRQLLSDSLDVVRQLLGSPTWRPPTPGDAAGPRVALHLPPGPAYVSGTLGVWLAGGTAVPLCLTHPDRELQYVIQDSGATEVLACHHSAARLAALASSSSSSSSSRGGPWATTTHALFNNSGGCSSGNDTYSKEGALRSSSSSSSSATSTLLQRQEQQQEGEHGELMREQVERLLHGRSDSLGSLIVYTSGTTGRPKGALHTHRGITAQVCTLVQAWGWAQDDVILHALPLHHVHGIVNALYCPLYCGAAVQFLPKFSPAAVWDALQAQSNPKVSVFMGVPTMYSYLLSHYKSSMSPEQQASARAAAARLRLTVSGSAACPVPIMRHWEEISGQLPLERYGMTETLMVLSNPLTGERRPGSVGQPLPGVEVKMEEVEGRQAAAAAAATGGTEGGGGDNGGELLVRSDSLFAGYWGRPEATAEAFDKDGYFRTGDTVTCDGQPPYWRILGRTSVDIIKSGGYKISALQVESTLAEHPALGEVAVVGLPNSQLGEEIAAVVAPRSTAAGGPPPPATPTLEELRSWAKDRLPPYQLPHRLASLPAGLPRNAMGKVNKKQLRLDVFGGEPQQAPKTG